MKTLIVTCTPDRFDIISHFSSCNEVVWRQTKSCQVGDLAYIYVGRPLSRIAYLCKVKATNIQGSEISLEYYQRQQATSRNRNKPYMKLELLTELNYEGLALADLLNHGLKTVQCTTEASDELKKYLRSIVGGSYYGNSDQR